MKGGGKLTFTGRHLALHTTTSAGMKSSSFCKYVADDDGTKNILELWIHFVQDQEGRSSGADGEYRQAKF